MLARVACLVLAASVVLACADQALLVADLRGSGDGPSNLIALAAGTYRIDWSGWDAEVPKDGCLLGLTLELTAEKPPEPGRALRVIPVPPKLTYRAVPAGAAVRGQAAPVKLFQGLYLIRAEGSCAWQVRLTATPEAPAR